MKLQDATVLVTGANRGLGLAFVRMALQRGACKVYAGVRNPDTQTLSGVSAVPLDVLNLETITAAARRCDDVTLVINNAGIAIPGGLLDPGGTASMWRHMETNVFGMLRVSQQFSPVLAKNGGGALINVLSLASFINSPFLSTYSVSKTAAWGLTNALRNEMRIQQTQVLAVHVGFIDTDLTKGFDVPKTPPEVVATRVFDALEEDASEVMADEITDRVKKELSQPDAPYLTGPFD